MVVGFWCYLWLIVITMGMYAIPECNVKYTVNQGYRGGFASGGTATFLGTRYKVWLQLTLNGSPLHNTGMLIIEIMHPGAP